MENDREAPKRGVDTHKGITMFIFDLAMEHWQYTLLAWFLFSFPAGCLVGYFLRQADPVPPEVQESYDALMEYEERTTLVAYLRQCPVVGYVSADVWTVTPDGEVTLNGS